MKALVKEYLPLILGNLGRTTSSICNQCHHFVDQCPLASTGKVDFHRISP